MDKRRVVITGVGAVTPGGNTADEFWALVAGRSDRPHHPARHDGYATRTLASSRPTR
jgi:3-oxoacyl-(acyl-carrier-protein) synthase